MYPGGPSGQYPGTNYGYPYGDHLLELGTGGPLELSFGGNNVLGVWLEISALTNLANGNFDATIEAVDGSNHSLGTYNIVAGGSGGVCGSVNTWILHNPPTPCNDAPEIGFYDPQGRIKSIYISAYDLSGNRIGFLIDSLAISEVPEPAMPLMIGGALAAMALYRRKRRSHAV
jgi:hypothetical protein